MNDLITPINTDPQLTILLTVGGVVLAVVFALGVRVGRRLGRAESVTAALTAAEERRVETEERAARPAVQSTRQEMAERVISGQAAVTTQATATPPPVVVHAWPLPTPPVRPEVIRIPPVPTSSGRHHARDETGVEGTRVLKAVAPRDRQETSS